MPKNSAPIPHRFYGFDISSCVKIPSEFLTHQMSTLSGVEVKVMLYLFLRTLWFDKTSDFVSVSQICDGVTNQSGEHIDYGTGCGKRSVWRALSRLNDVGLVEVFKSDDESIFHPNLYRLKVRYTPVTE